MIKSTYGTGCFALLNTGTTPVASKNKLLTTIAYQLKRQAHLRAGRLDLRRRLRRCSGCATGSASSSRPARPARSPTNPIPMQSVYLVPAFVGLGAPYWNPRVRGALFGLTRNTGPAELAHAALESVCYQTFDLVGRDARRLARTPRPPTCCASMAA